MPKDPLSSSLNRLGHMRSAGLHVAKYEGEPIGHHPFSLNDVPKSMHERVGPQSGDETSDYGNADNTDMSG